MAVILTENFRAVFYTPFYLPHVLGAYEAEGVDVELRVSKDLDSVAAQLQQGSTDVHWGGPMRIMMNHDRDPDCGLVGFCETVTRDPFFLIGRVAKPDFQMSDLADVTLASVSEVPTPWMCLQDDMRRAGMDPDAMRRVTDGTMPDNTAALRRGDVDVIQVFQPFAEELVADGVGHIWHAAATRGPCSYTTLYTVRKTLDTQRDALYRMTRAMSRAQKWLHGHSAADVAAAIAGFFEDVPRDRIEGAVARYQDLGIWGQNPVLPRAGFERLRVALLSGGLIKREIPFEDCVDNSLADIVAAEDLPSI